MIVNRFNTYEGRKALKDIESKDNNPMYVEFFKQRAFLEALCLQCSRTVEALEENCLKGKFEQNKMLLDQLKDEFHRIDEFFNESKNK